MIFKKLLKLILIFALILHNSKAQVVLGVYHHGLSTNTGELEIHIQIKNKIVIMFLFLDCLTPDRLQGSCVPAAKCRRIEWMLRNWSAPYPENIVQYIRQSHCGTRGEIVSIFYIQFIIIYFFNP